MKRKAKKPNKEELKSRISRKISEGANGEILATKLDFDYAYGQIRLDDDTKNLSIFTVTRGDFTGYYHFLKGFYGLADIPTIFQERRDTTLEHTRPEVRETILIWILIKSKEMRILQKRNRMGRSQNRPTKDTTPSRQIGCNKNDNIPKNEK